MFTLCPVKCSFFCVFPESDKIQSQALSHLFLTFHLLHLPLIIFLHSCNPFDLFMDFQFSFFFFPCIIMSLTVTSHTHPQSHTIPSQTIILNFNLCSILSSHPLLHTILPFLILLSTPSILLPPTLHLPPSLYLSHSLPHLPLLSPSLKTHPVDQRNAQASASAAGCG